MLAFLAWLEDASLLLSDAWADIVRSHPPDSSGDLCEIAEAESELHEAFWSEDNVRLSLALRRWRLAHLPALGRREEPGVAPGGSGGDQVAP